MRTSHEHVTAKIDWLQMIFYHCSIEELLEFLQIEKSHCLIEEGKIQNKDYDTCYSYGSLRIYTHEECQREECYLIMSGDACTLYEQFLDVTKTNWKQFFYKLFSQFDGRCKITRLDIALDDRNEIPYFTVEKLIKKCKQGRYYSNRRKFQICESKVVGTKTSKTLYIGKRKSNIMFRIYDKDLETAEKSDCALVEIGSWKRLEIELKRDIAHSMVQIIAHEEDTLGNLARGLIKEELTFYADAECKKIAPFWIRYLGKEVAPLKVPRKYEIKGLLATEHWLQYGGALSALKAFRFLHGHYALGHLQNLEPILQEIELPRTLAKKVVDHLIAVNRQDLIVLVNQMSKKESSANTHHEHSLSLT